MSSNSSEDSDGGELRKQPAITDYVTYECSICGRTSDEKPACHPPRVIQAEHRLSTEEWLFPSARSPGRFNGRVTVVGSDRVTYECSYATLRSLLGSELDYFEQYIEQTPYQIPDQPWIEDAYRQHHEKEYRQLWGGIAAALRACEARVEKMSNEFTLSEVYAHLVYLDQYGLVPVSNHHSVNRGLLKSCSKYYDVSIDELHSEWLVERRIDRSKVFSTTKKFRQAWDLELVGDVPDSHPHTDYKPFNGMAVIGDHRDHNLITRQAKKELLTLPYVEWSVAPHFYYLRSSDGSTQESASNTPPIVGFDFAGFDYVTNGHTLRYLGIVTEREEDPFEIYLQVEQLSETHANGIVILNNREAIYDFLHFLKTDKGISRTEALPDSRDEYYSIPNVRTLHEKMVSQVGILDGIALMPRRKFIDEGFQTIDDLIPVPTYASSKFI